jgi:hypothetical protein
MVVTPGQGQAVDKAPSICGEHSGTVPCWLFSIPSFGSGTGFHTDSVFSDYLLNETTEPFSSLISYIQPL